MIRALEADGWRQVAQAEGQDRSAFLEAAARARLEALPVQRPEFAVEPVLTSIAIAGGPFSPGPSQGFVTSAHHGVFESFGGEGRGAITSLGALIQEHTHAKGKEPGSRG